MAPVEGNNPDTDQVKSYFGMRKIALGKDEKGVVRPMLNNKFVFQSGPLDQGFWPDGIYTAPTDEALRYDIEITKKLGFNMTRKHVKVEPRALVLLVRQTRPAGLAGHARQRYRKGRQQAERGGTPSMTKLPANLRGNSRRWSSSTSTIRASLPGSSSTKGGASTIRCGSPSGCRNSIPPGWSTKPAGGTIAEAAT